VHPVVGKSGVGIASELGPTDHESDPMLSLPSIPRIGGFVNLTGPWLWVSYNCLRSGWSITHRSSKRGARRPSRFGMIVHGREPGIP
jgi:hypothetical protein